MKILVTAFAIVVASSAVAAEYETYLLPVAPSVVFCGYESRYETRLVVFNGNDRPVERLCTDTSCDGIAPRGAQEFSGGYAGGLPLPMFVYLPKDSARAVEMSLVVESSERTRLDERSFTELPVVRADQFTSGTTQFVGVRIDPGFRQTVRIFGLDGRAAGELMMRVYSLADNELLHSCSHVIAPLSSEVTAEGLPMRPSFGMECDMSEHIDAEGQKVRIEIEPLTPGLVYWSLVSIANNKTQHFYTVLPR